MYAKQIAVISALAVAVAVLAVPVGSSLAATPGFGQLYYDGDIVRTIVPPSATDKGLDDLYAVTSGAEGQLGIASVAPGDVDYHGGHWIVNMVTFNEGVTPYLLTSEDVVLEAYANGDVTIAWNTGSFLCPIQP
jgi:hypothetical protein